MAELLSQNEIDDLLKSLTAGDSGIEIHEESASPKVKVYDFKTANKFSKEQIKILHNIYEIFSQMFSSTLSGILRTNCNADVVSVEEQTYNEYINSLPSPTALAIFDIKPMGSSTLLEFSPIISAEIINRMLGGGGITAADARGFTEIDLALLEKAMGHIAQIVDTSWSKVIKVETELKRIETSPQFAQIISFNETIAIITINVKIGDKTEGAINVCIPHIAIEPIAKQLNTKLWYTSEKTGFDEKSSANIKRRIVNTKVNVTAIFKESTATVRDIVDLQVGDVMQLTHKVGERVIIRIGNANKFYGELGVSKNKYAVKISDTIREADIENE